MCSKDSQFLSNVDCKMKEYSSEMNKKTSEEAIIDSLIKNGESRELERYSSIYSNQKDLLVELLKSNSIPEDTKLAYDERFEFLNNVITDISKALSRA